VREKRIIRHTPGSRTKDRTDWKRVDTPDEEQIVVAAQADPDASLTDEEFWKDARLVRPERRISVTLRVKPNVLAWYKSGGRGYQTRMNSVLETYMEQSRRRRSRSGPRF
jgi:uncharacterized protein (DUF4415 family)